MLQEGPEVTTFRSPSGNPNGQTLDRQGRLITCEHSGRRVVRTEIDGTISVLAEFYQEKVKIAPMISWFTPTAVSILVTLPLALAIHRAGRNLVLKGLPDIAAGRTHIIS